MEAEQRLHGGRIESGWIMNGGWVEDERRLE